ncbi:myogenesis-regulating glycosidase isoform X2 [Cephus cinctus]|uniref:Myogenesis-regulating glycosidase isoform X2 n=1 Tax=Cephus cinctus TaxID=211228 RepID=A0AAJ7W5A6_CEPCN|nr:myogenesis-regulating glycosidase isoform X2 [Cephus cinctus]
MSSRRPRAPAWRLLGHEIPEGVPDVVDGSGGWNLYPSCKHATVAMTHTIRRELAKIKVPIRVTSISPGLVRTNISGHTPSLKKFFDKLECLEPEDVADGVVYALGTRSKIEHINGRYIFREESLPANQSAVNMWRVHVVGLLVIFLSGIGKSSEPGATFSANLGNRKVNLKEDGENFSVELERADGTKALKILFISEAKSTTTRTSPRFIQDCPDEAVCIQSNDLTRITMTQPDFEVVNIAMHSPGNDTTYRNCIKLDDDVQWFGGPQQKKQFWPVQHMVYQDYAYLPIEDQNAAIAEPYWLNGKGTFIYVNRTVPLFIDQNIYKYQHLCLVAKIDTPYRPRGYVHLNYNVGTFANPRLAHEYAVENFLGKPTDIPDKAMVTYPIWSSWAKYKVSVSDFLMREYAGEILANNFTNSQIEIDDLWETCYGSLTFDTSATKFPNIRNLTTDLHNLGFRVTLWIHPFINVDCTEYYNLALRNGYLVKNINGSVETSWWQGSNATIVDFTNPEAVTWFTGRLNALKESSGIDSFKFDAGEISWLPQPADLTGNLEEQPGIFTALYSKHLSEFGSSIEIRSGWGTQNLPRFVRIIDKDTRWTWDNGLPTLITTTLTMNIAGYVFVLPDMVGGNGYVGDEALISSTPPEKELFIRWLQVNTFLPAIQYSFVPWTYDRETIEICRKYTDLHIEYARVILDIMDEAVSTGAPVNPPIWWVDPDNKEAHKISDEYMLGTTILVAPVIEEGAVTRNIYLPSGHWREEAYSNHTVYVGPTWIYDYPAPLDVLPYFTLVTQSSGTVHIASALFTLLTVIAINI